MKLALDMFLTFMICMLLFACMVELPNAIGKEKQYRDELRVARCSRDWMPGYCEGLSTKLAMNHERVDLTEGKKQ